MIGLAPEGGDSAGGILSLPPPGVGRFMLHLAAIGLQIAPVGIYEEDGRLCLRFGQRYRLELAAGLPAVERDRCASQIVMSNIARLLPAALQGEFST